MNFMTMVFLMAILAIGLALLFTFTNGFHDSASQVAAVIASNAMSPGKALFIAAAGDFVGAVFLGRAVAETLVRGIVDPNVFAIGASGVIVVLAAFSGAILWNLVTWYFGMPSSSSHALIGGLVGAFVVAWGLNPVNWTEILSIVIVMAASPFVGFMISYLVTVVTFVFSRFATPKVNRVFNKAQFISLIGQSLSHGTNDGQKTMGIIMFVLVLLGFYALPSSGQSFVPTWIVVLSALTMSLGTLTGGWRIIKKLGAGLYKIRPIHAFSSQITSAIIIYAASIFGFPISTTQVIASSVMGAGTASRPKMVRWLVARDMLLAWLVTIPVSALIAAISYFVIKIIFNTI